MRKIVLCGRGACCPEVFMDANEIRIQDDYMNEIRMSKEQFEILKDKIDRGEIY